MCGATFSIGNATATVTKPVPSEREDAHQHNDRLKSPRSTSVVGKVQEGGVGSASVNDAVAGEPDSSSSYGGSVCPVIQVNLAETPADNECDSTAKKISLSVKQEFADRVPDKSDNGRSAQQSGTSPNAEASPVAGAAERSASTQVSSSLVADPQVTFAHGCKERNDELTAQQHSHRGDEDQAQRDEPKGVTEMSEAPSSAIKRTLTIDSEGSYPVPGVDRHFFGL